MLVPGTMGTEHCFWNAQKPVDWVLVDALVSVWFLEWDCVRDRSLLDIFKEHLSDDLFHSRDSIFSRVSCLI